MLDYSFTKKKTPGPKTDTMGKPTKTYVPPGTP